MVRGRRRMFGQGLPWPGVHPEATAYARVADTGTDREKGTEVIWQFTHQSFVDEYVRHSENKIM